MNIFSKRDNKNLLTLLLVVILLLSSWFRNGNLFSGAEEGMPFYNLEITNKLIPNVWSDLYLGLPYLSEMSRLPYFRLIYWLNVLGVSNLALQIFTFLIISFGSGMAVYFLIKITLEKIVKENINVPLIGALFYLVNPYVISQVWGRGLYTQFFVYLYQPVLLLLFILGLQKKRIIYVFISILLSFVLAIAIGNPAYAASFWALITTYFFYFLFINRADKNNLRQGVIYFIVFFVGWVFVNLWWLLVYLKFGSVLYLVAGTSFDNSIESLKSVSAQNPFDSVLRLYHIPHFESVSLYGSIYKNILFITSSWLVPVISIFSIKFFKKGSTGLIFYGALFILGLFVCLGSNPPFGRIFIWFFNHFPPLEVFRNPYEKFGLVFLLGYTPFFALGFVSLYGFLKYRIQKYAFLIMSLIFLLYFGVYMWPMWTGSVISWGTQIKVSSYYADFNNWQLQNKKPGQFLFFLPYLSDFGASYKWPNGEYHGSDPIYQIVDSPVITQTGRIDYLMALKRYFGRINPAVALSLIRSKYIVVRDDVNSTRRDRLQEQFLNKIYTAGIADFITPICLDEIPSEQDFKVDCKIPDNLADFSKVKFLQIKIVTTQDAYLEIFLEDQLGVRPRWSGQKIEEYRTRGGQESLITVPIGDPTDNPDTDYSQIKKIQIFAKKDSLNTRIEKLTQIGLDVGQSRDINEYKPLISFGKLRVYEPTQYMDVPEFGVLDQLESVPDFYTMWTKAEEKREKIDHQGFLISSQNIDKKIPLNEEFNRQVEEKKKISETRYYLKLSPDNKSGLVVLNKPFNPYWKLVPLQDGQKIIPGLMNDFELIKMNFLDEKNHLELNGYSNLWLVDGKENDFEIIFLPQIFMDLYLRVSIYAFLITLAIVAGLFLKGRLEKKL